MKTLPKKPALLLRPNIANAMIPKVIRSLITSLLVTIFFYGFFGYLVLVDFLKITLSFYIIANLLNNGIFLALGYYS